MNGVNEGPPCVLYVNGRLCAQDRPALSALDRGFTLGDGVFETMLAHGCRIFRLAQHLERLERSAGVLELPLPQRSRLAGALNVALSDLRAGNAIVRLTVSRGPDPGRGVALPASPAPTVVVRAVPAVPPSAEAYQKGLDAIVASVRRNEGSPLSRIKSCNYGDAVLARREAQRKGAEEAILLNNRGQVACASTANVFIVTQRTLRTPSEECGVLAGITRACVLELAAACGIPAEVSPFTPDLLLGADEVFITNTAFRLMPVTHIEGQAIGGGRPGPITLRLSSAYERLLATELTDAPASA